MALATNEFSAAMKINYLPALNDTVYRQTVMLDRLEKNSEDVSGLHAYVALISARNPAVGSRADTNAVGPTLPEAGRQTYSSATFPMTYHYGRGSISGPVMRASKDPKGAFAKALDSEMRGLSKTLPEDLNRQIWSYGHGRAGTLATGQATQSSSTVVDFDANSIFNIKVGDRIHFSTINAFVLQGASNLTVASIAFDNATDEHGVTLASSVTFAVTLDRATDACYYGSRTSGTVVAGDSSFHNDMLGISAIVDDSNIGADEGTTTNAAEINGGLQLGGITRSTNPFWQAQVMDNPPDTGGTNRPLTIALMQEAYLRGGVNGSDQQMLEIYSGPSLWSTYGLLHIGDRRYNGYEQKIEGGWIAQDFNGRPFFFDRDCPRHRIWFLDMSTLFLLTQSGYEFMDDDGSVLNRVADTDAYEFTLYRDVQMGTRGPKPNVLLADIESSSAQINVSI